MRLSKRGALLLVLVFIFICCCLSDIKIVYKYIATYFFVTILVLMWTSAIMSEKQPVMGTNNDSKQAEFAGQEGTDKKNYDRPTVVSETPPVIHCGLQGEEI